MNVSDYNNGDYVRVRLGDQVLGHRVKLMLNALSRLRGLLGTTRLSQGSGALLSPCRSVHMFGMLYSIDVLFLDRHQRVVRVKQNVRPFMVASGGRGAHATLELPAASLSRVEVKAGDQITVEHCGPSAAEQREAHS